MKKSLLFVAAIISLKAFSQNNFISRIGTGGYEALYDVIQTPDGGFIGTGYTVNSPMSNDGLYIIKVDANGQELWNKIVEVISDFDQGYGIINTSDGGFIISGTIAAKLAILKFNQDGNLSWSKQYNELLLSEGSKLVQTEDGGYLLAGRISPDGANRYQSYLVKTDASGNLEWAKKYFTSYFSSITDLQKTNDGNYAFIAVNYFYDEQNDEFSDDTTYLVKVNTSGNVLWSKYFTAPEGGADGISLLPTSDGGYLVTGYHSFEKGFVVKIDENGSYKWSKAVDDENDNFLFSAIETSDGEYVVTGYSENSGAASNIYLCKLNTSGTTIWTKELNIQDGNSMILKLSKTADGGYIGSGVHSIAGDRTEAALFVKFDADFNTCIPAGIAQGLTDFGLFGNATVPAFTGSPTVSSASLSISSGGNFTNICTALPLTLLDFTATLKTKAVALTWKTAEERNTAYFDVEKSMDAKTFASISQVKAAGNSTIIKSYDAEDYNPATGDNWYRLKMVDKDGQFAYSNVVKITFTGKSNMLVYPNPAVNNATVAFNVEKAGNYSIQVTDMYGKVLHAIKGAAVMGENKVNLPLNNYSKGIYLVNIKTETSKSTLKLNKQ